MFRFYFQTVIIHRNSDGKEYHFDSPVNFNIFQKTATLGFLTEVDFSSTKEGEDFSEAYTHDMNANILTVRCSGLKAGGGWGTVVNTGIVRDGNLPTRLQPRAEVMNPTESRAHAYLIDATGSRGFVKRTLPS